MSRDAMTLLALLDDASLAYRSLPEPERAEAERRWRAIYGDAFRGRPRMRHGNQAVLECAQQTPGRWLVVPMSTGVAGTPVTANRPGAPGFECDGPLVPLGAACHVEFAIFPSDLSWSMLHTHEDHELGGPYFIRRSWL